MTTPLALRSRDITLAYSFLRIIMGVCYFNIGFNRLGNIPGFVNAMAQMFQDTYMPPFLVQANAVLITPIEFIAGLFLILGLFTRASLIALLAVMVVLMYGVTLVQNSELATSQLMYNLLLAILLAGLRFNTFSLDHWWQQRQSRQASAEDESTPRTPLLRFWQPRPRRPRLSLSRRS